MGSAMTQNLLTAGFAVVVYNRTQQRALPLRELGAEIADTPAAAAKKADVVLTMVTDDRASRSVWLGEDGILSGAQPQAILIESSTVSPSWIHELSGHAAGFRLLDAPVAGSKPQAIAKDLGYALEEAGKHNAPLPTTAIARVLSHGNDARIRRSGFCRNLKGIRVEISSISCSIFSTKTSVKFLVWCRSRAALNLGRVIN